MKRAVCVLLCSLVVSGIGGCDDPDTQITLGGDDAGQRIGIVVSETLAMEMQASFETISAEYSPSFPFEYLNVRFDSSQNFESDNPPRVKSVFIAPNSVDVAIPDYDTYWFEESVRDFFAHYGAHPVVSDSWVQGGFEVSESLVKHLAARFEETRDCMGYFPRGKFKNLLITLMPHNFWQDGKKYSGRFLSPNKIFLGGNNITWVHEVIHYLLFKNTGDADGEHQSQLFNKCTQGIEP